MASIQCIGYYTTDSSHTIKVAKYNGYDEMTCAEILQTLKNTDNLNNDIVGFFATPNSDGETHEIQPLNIKAGDDVYIWNCFPDWTRSDGDTNYIYMFVKNKITTNCRGRQYFRKITSGGVTTFNGYREASMGTHVYNYYQYIGKGANDTALTYSSAILYINPQTFGTIHYNESPSPGKFLLKLTDTVPIKRSDNSGNPPYSVSVQEILNFGTTNNYGNAFGLYDTGNSRSGLVIRYFNIDTSNPVYLATINYINYSGYIGIKNNGMTTTQNTGYWYTGSAFSGAGVSINFISRTVDNISYNCNGGYASNYAYEQAFYIPSNNIYIDGSPYITINWHSVQSITGNGLTIPLVTLKSDAINGGEPVSNGTISSFTNQPSNDNNVKYLVDLSISAASNDITVDYTIPTITKGSYISVKLFGKIGELPACNENDDVIEDLDPIESSKDIYSLPGGTYYFCIRTITSDGLKLTSNALSITIADPVPEDLKPYVKLINDITGYTYDGMGGFTMYDYTIGSDGTNPNYDPYCRNYSWRNQHWAGPGQSQPVITNSNFDTATILPHSIMDVNVDTSTFTITSNTVASPMIFSTRYQQYGHRYYQGSYFYGYPCSSNSINVGTYSSTIGTQGYNSGDTSVSFSSQYLTTTFDCVKWVAQNFRNINLYVDGVLWSKANNTN